MYGPPTSEQLETFLEAIVDGSAYYLECDRGHASLPPQRYSPECAIDELTARPLQIEGEVVTYTHIKAAPPEFSDSAPYTVAVAAFGPVRLTGRIVDGQAIEVDVGATVTPVRATSGTDDANCVGFRLLD